MKELSAKERIELVVVTSNTARTLLAIGDVSHPDILAKYFEVVKSQVYDLEQIVKKHNKE